MSTPAAPEQEERTEKPPRDDEKASISFNVEFGGGLELLFDKIKKLAVTMFVGREQKNVSLRDVIFHLRDNYLKERPELFLQNETVRPGILVLVNDTDWELDGGLDAPVAQGDTVVFISTLHGG